MKNFQSNKEDFRPDEYVREKHVIGKTIFALMQNRLREHVWLTNVMQLAAIKKNHYFSADITIGKTFRLMNKHFSILKKIVGQDAVLHYKNMERSEKLEIVNRYHQPGINFFSENVYPWFGNITDEKFKEMSQDEEADWREVPRTTFIRVSDLGLINTLDKDGRFEKQQAELEDLAALFAPLICLTPDRLSLEDLQYYKKEYLQSAAFDKLRLSFEARVQQGQGPDASAPSQPADKPKEP